MSRPTGSRSLVLHIWSEDEKEYIKQITPGHHHKEIQKLMSLKFNREFTLTQIKAAIKRYELNTGFTGHFSQGHIPANKGMKGYHAPGSEKGWFKKGNMPINHKPVGSERVDVDGYTLIKTAEPNVWKLKHKVLWEENKGKVPEGYVLTFLDGNKRNIKLENLTLISMAESLELTRSGLRSEYAELTKTGILVIKVKKACTRKVIKSDD